MKIQEFLNLYKLKKVSQEDRYYDEMFLQIENYDLKIHWFKDSSGEEKKISETEEALSRWIKYKTTDTVDLDGCGEGKGICTFSREVYKLLWGFEDTCQCRNGTSYSRYGYSKFMEDKKIKMGPDTMNTVSTPLKQFLRNNTKILDYYKGKFDTDKKQKEVTPAFLQKILDSDEGEKWEDFNCYINTFFLWDYVTANENEYIIKSLYKDDNFLDNVCLFIRRRSLFMAAMLKLAVEYRDLYDNLMKSISSDRIINGYDSVFGCLLGEESNIEVHKELIDKLSEEDKELLRMTWERIKEIE